MKKTTKISSNPYIKGKRYEFRFNTDYLIEGIIKEIYKHQIIVINGEQRYKDNTTIEFDEYIIHMNRIIYAEKCNY